MRYCVSASVFGCVCVTFGQRISVERVKLHRINGAQRLTPKTANSKQQTAKCENGKEHQNRNCVVVVGDVGWCGRGNTLAKTWFCGKEYE